MKPNKTLINALRNVADKIETNPHIWEWGEFDSCNCGLLAIELGVSECQINEIFHSHQVGMLVCSWKNFAEEFSQEKGKERVCYSTGLKIESIFETLSHYGIEPEDLGIIESLHIKGFKSGKKVLVENFRELADNLETRLLSQQLKEKEPSHQPVGV